MSLANITPPGVYYFVSYVEIRHSTQLFDSVVIDIHPFVWLNSIINSETNKYMWNDLQLNKRNIVLLNWTRLSEQEVALAQEAENNYLSFSITQKVTRL